MEQSEKQIKMRTIIINADDYGLNEHCSRAIEQAFRVGIITDTTMMATGDYFDEAIALAREYGFINQIGVHLNLTEGEPLTDEIRYISDFVTDGCFNKHYRRTKPLSRKINNAIYQELTAQVEKIQNVGITITHADSHHHIHTALFIAPIVARVCMEHGITKIRLHRNIGSISGFKMLIKKKYNNWLHSQGFATTDYFGSLRDIENAGIPDNCEIMVHPDFDKNGILIDRHGIKDSFPIGSKLPDLRTERKVFLRGYSEL